MENEFLSKTNAWWESIDLTLETILLRAFNFDVNFDLTPWGAIGEPRMIYSSIDVILMWGRNSLNSLMTGSGFSRLIHVNSHLLEFISRPMAFKSLWMVCRSSRTICGLSAKFESSRYQRFNSHFRLFTIWSIPKEKGLGHMDLPVEFQSLKK